MAYSSNPGSAADALSGGGETHDESMHEENMAPEKGNLFLTADMLPEGMKPNPGDELVFKVIRQDSDGDWEISYAEGKGSKKEDTSWEDETRSKFSPRNTEQEGAM